jgi:uncharacterized Ntn-hydrolase superfamily protein
VTYSIVARDPATGELGVAVQSHWFSVGSSVPWAEPGVGAVATQSIADPSHGPNALDLLRTGTSAADALETLVKRDKQAAVRQVVIVDSRGRAAVHTGRRCVPFAGDHAGRGFACAANMMAREGVPQAMAHAYTTAIGEMPDRLLAALDAAEAAGGDVRGRQSAAMIVVRSRGEQWHRSLDLRVEDSAFPLVELRRLARLRQAYDLGERADELAGEGRTQEAALLYRRASEVAPENDELRFWGGLALVQLGERAAGVEAVRSAIADNAGLAELLARLSPEIAPSASAVRETLARDGDSR